MGKINGSGSGYDLTGARESHPGQATGRLEGNSVIEPAPITEQVTSISDAFAPAGEELFNLAPVGLVLSDHQGVAMRANREAARLLGRSVEQIIGLSLAELVHAKDQSIFVDGFSQALRGGEASLKLRPAHPGNRGSHLALDCRPLVGPTGQVSGCWLALSTDGTPVEQEDKEALRDSRNALQETGRLLGRLEELFDVSQDVLAAENIDQLLQRMIDAARELTRARLGTASHGYHNGEFRIGALSKAEGAPACPSGKEFTIERGGVYMELIKKHSVLRLSQEELEAHEAWWGLPTGHAQLRGLLGASLVDRTGKTRGLIMVSDKVDGGDFTAEDEHLLAELAILASLGFQHLESRAKAEEGDETLRALLDFVPEGIAIADAPDVSLRLMSRQGRQIFGLDDNESLDIPLDARSSYFAIYKADGKTLQDPADLPLAQAVRTGELVEDRELVLCLGDNQKRTILSSAAPMKDQNGKVTGGIAVWRDISEIKQTQDALDAVNHRLESLAAALVDANRELSQFAYAASHDLKSPLRAITNYASFLLEDLTGKLEPEHQEYLEGMLKAARQGQVLVDDILALASLRREPGQGRPVNLADLVREAVERLESAEDVTVNIAGGWPVLEVEAPVLKQMLQNLLDNAVKFNISNPKRIWLDWRENGGWLEISVRDNGIGIEESSQKDIFQVFRRLHSYDEYPGTGVGLALVQKAAQRLGGEVAVESEPGQGSTFTIKLPRQREDDDHGIKIP